MQPRSHWGSVLPWTLVVAVLVLQFTERLHVFEVKGVRKHDECAPASEQVSERLLHPAFIFPQLYRCDISHPPSHEEHQSQSREDVWLFEKIFSHNISLSRGTFIEIGALDGQTFSNTWYFEQKWDWRGILIEGLPSNQPLLRATGRRNVALFTTGICRDNPGTLSFTVGGGAVGGTAEFSTPDFLTSWHGGTERANVRSACVPLQLILDATGVLDIDLFSLDVEGAELAVLETIDWSITNIHVIVVELDNLSPTKDQEVRDLLLGRGYINAAGMYGSIREACVPGGDCTMNEVFLNPEFHSRRRAQLQRFQFGTGLECT
jgi:FkbM family methyltransferase